MQEFKDSNASIYASTCNKSSHILKAIKAHNNQIKQCLGANGFDRHFAALKVHAARNGIDVSTHFSAQFFFIFSSRNDI